MKAELIYRSKEVEVDSIVEIKIWAVPISQERPHGYKYSLVYIKGGRRIVGYDNAEGKGDHRHYEDRVESYRFKSIDKLFEDFYRDIRRLKK